LIAVLASVPATGATTGSVKGLGLPIIER